MKKKVFTFLLIFVMVLSFSACGDSASDEEDTEVTEPVTIIFAAQDDSTPATQAVLDAFNESQSDYIAEWKNMTNDSGLMHDQLNEMFDTGSAEIDIMSMDVVWAGEFADAGYLVAIDDFMSDASLAASDFNAGSMASGRVGSEQFTLPFFPDLGILYFRQDIVSDEDIAQLVSGDYTYADLKDMAEKYKGKEGTKDGFVYQSSKYEGLICNANEFTANWFEIKDGLEMMKAFTDSKVTPKNILEYTEGETAESFGTGVSVFSRNWPYQWGDIKSNGSISQDQVDVAPLPNGGSVGGWLLGISNSSENKDGAWALMKFIATEGQKILSIKGGYLPGYNPMLSDEEIIASNELLSKPGFQAALLTTIARPVSASYTAVSESLQDEIFRYLSGEENINDTVNAVEDILAGAKN